jgi:hypothetical protein
MVNKNFPLAVTTTGKSLLFVLKIWDKGVQKDNGNGKKNVLVEQIATEKL